MFLMESRFSLINSYLVAGTNSCTIGIRGGQKLTSNTISTRLGNSISAKLYSLSKLLIIADKLFLVLENIGFSIRDDLIVFQFEIS